MQRLNFGNYQFRYRNTGDKISVFDEIRKKFVVLTPEEWVRQHVVHYFLHEKKFPKSLVNVEKLLTINGLTKRYDIVIFNTDGSVHILVECKAPQVKISQSVFDQIARYNLTMRAQLLMVTNGLDHYFCRLDYDRKQYDFLQSLPDYQPSQTASS